MQQPHKLRWLKVLLLEDLQADVFLIQSELKKVVEELDLMVTKNGKAFEQFVRHSTPHVIISDYALPQYSGLAALKYAMVNAPNTPFVFVTATLQDEELAAETILNGANGFVLKNNLQKLGPLVHNLMTRPQTDTPFEIPSHLWISHYEQELALWEYQQRSSPEAAPSPTSEVTTLAALVNQSREDLERAKEKLRKAHALGRGKG